MKSIDIKRSFILLICLLITSCADFWGPEDPSEESKTVPWNQLSGRIVFVSYSSEMGRSYSTLYLMNASKKTIEPLYTFNGVSPAWSFDGAFLLAVGGGQIGVTNLTDSNYNISIPKKNIRYGTWNLLNQIAVVLSDSSSDSSYSVLINDKILLQNINGRKTRIALSHDGKYAIVCISKPSILYGNAVNIGIYRINLSDSSIFTLRTSNAPNEYYESPIFSFNDKKITFIKVIQGTIDIRELWVMNDDGTNSRIISSGGWESDPVFSPSNEKIMFGKEGKLFLINIDGTGLVQIIKTTGGGSPTWTN